VATFKRDERKASKWFQHARVAADGRNYDYSIECYIHGLEHDPDNMTAHEELREVSLKRKVAGGKPPGFADKLKIKHGKDAIGKFLDPVHLLALDPLNLQYMVAVMERATEAAEAIEDLHMEEVVYWVVDTMVLRFNRESKKPDRRIFIKAMECCKRLQIWPKAIEACRLAVQMDPSDSLLIQELKDLEAENVMREGGYDQVGEAGGFRRSIRDADLQRALEEEDTIAKTEDALDATIERRRREYEEDPSDIDRLLKYVGALRQKDTNEFDQEAVRVLKDALETTGQYRFKLMIGDLRIRAMKRQLARLKADHEARPDDAEARQAYIEGSRQLLAFELQEFEERVKNYPTDMGLRFQYGRRLFQAKRYDEAISALQQAKADPKVRAASTSLLGQAYMKQGWFDEAIETLEQGVEQHQIADDQLGMDLRYHLMDAYEKKARQERSLEAAQKAQRIASQLLQTNIKYRDIKDRINEIRALNDELKSSQ